MFGIGHLFGRISNSFTREISLRSTIRECLLRTVGIDVPIENIIYKNNLVTLKSLSSAARSVIFIKKPILLKEFEEKGIANVKDIR